MTWRVTALKRALRPGGRSTGLIKGEVADEPGDGLYPGFSASGQDVWLQNAQFNGPGLVLSAVGARCGKVFEARGEWGTVANTAVLIPQTGHDPHFLWYLVNNEDFWEKGGAAQPYVRLSETLERRLSLPELGEQRAIADHLDAETVRIDALIEKKRRMVELMEEGWQAFLGSVLRPASGLRFKLLLAAPLAYGVLVPEHDESGVPMLRIMDLVPGGVALDSVARIPSVLSSQYHRTVLAVGDLVVSVVGTLGRSIEVTSELAGCNVNRALARVQLQEDVPRSLVRFWFGSLLFQDLARLATSSDSAQPTLGLGDLKDFQIGLPDDRSVWPQMSQVLELRRTEVERMTDTLQRQVNLLVERRQALITAAVTGELDVPGVAA